MVRKLFNSEVKIRKIASHIVVGIFLNDKIIKEISLLFILLKEDLTDEIELVFTNYTLLFKKSNNRKSIIQKMDHSSVSCSISLDSLEYGLFFLLGIIGMILEKLIMLT